MFHFAEPELNGFGVSTCTPGLDQVVPALDVLRVAVAHREDDDGVGGDAVVGLLVPVRVDEAGVDEQVDVVPGREEDDVGLQAVRDGARLVGRGAVGLAERDVRCRPGVCCQAWMIFPITVFGVE